MARIFLSAMLLVSIPLILVTAIFVAGYIIWRRANLRDPENFKLAEGPLLKLSVDEVRPLVDRMTSRLAWAATATVFLIVSLSSIFVSAMVIRQMGGDNFGRRLIIGLSVVTALVISFVWLSRAAENSGPLFLDRLIAETSGRIVPHRFIAIGNALAFIGIVFILGGSCSVIASTGRTPDEVSRQVDDLAMLLYAGAALLVTSVLEINQLHRWSGDSVSKEVRPEIHRAAAVLAVTVGTFFSLLLAAAYVPAVVILQYRGIPAHQSVGSALQNAFHFALVLSPLVVGLASSHWNSSSPPSQ